MKIIFHLLHICVFTAALFAFSSCEITSLSDDPSGTYSYEGYTENLTLIVTGTLEIDFSNEDEITGSWQIDAVIPEDDIGPQIGSGELIGGIEDSVIMLNLNPHNADNNVILIGELDGNNFTGIWQYVGFPGVINEGKFQASKQN